MAERRSYAGWVAFAGILMWILGMIDIFQGFIAIIRDKYYVVTPSQLIIFDVTNWGWITLLWGIVLIVAGSGLLAGKSWARWFTIIAASLTFIEQLGFLGGSQYVLWTLTVIALNIIVLYALIVRWGDAKDALSTEY